MSTPETSSCKPLFTPFDIDSIYSYDCDEFTKGYMQQNHGVEDFNPLNLRPQTAQATPHPLAQMDFGEQQVSLVPRAPKKDYKKMLNNDKKNLRFSASIVSKRPEDKGRSFVITFFLADETISIYEKPRRYIFFSIVGIHSLTLETLGSEEASFWIDEPSPNPVPRTFTKLWNCTLVL
jgi:hypothetical protein